MATYFTIKSFDGRNRSFDQADRLAVSMIRRVKALNARVVAVRSLGGDGFVYSVPGRHIPFGAVVSKLRRDPAMTPFQISDEAASVEGPFEWEQRGSAVLEQTGRHDADGPPADEVTDRDGPSDRSRG